MQAHRADELRWWIARIAFYLVAWILADLVAFAIRFSQAGPYAGLTRWLWVSLPVKVVLLVVFVPRRTGERSERLALVA